MTEIPSNWEMINENCGINSGIARKDFVDHKLTISGTSLGVNLMDVGNVRSRDEKKFGI